VSEKAAEAGKDAEKPKKGKKRLLVIVAAALLVVSGVGGFLMFSGGKSGKPTEKPKPTPGAVLALDAVTVNLAEGHYLKIKLALQLTAAAGTGKEMDGSKALDLAITQFTDVAVAELSSADGRAKAKSELLEKLEKAYEDEVMDIYFTQFVMQ
jgi:flagellar FliL protein